VKLHLEDQLVERLRELGNYPEICHAIIDSDLPLSKRISIADAISDNLRVWNLSGWVAFIGLICLVISVVSGILGIKMGLKIELWIGSWILALAAGIFLFIGAFNLGYYSVKRDLLIEDLSLFSVQPGEIEEDPIT